MSLNVDKGVELLGGGVLQGAAHLVEEAGEGGLVAGIELEGGGPLPHVLKVGYDGLGFVLLAVVGEEDVHATAGDGAGHVFA